MRSPATYLLFLLLLAACGKVPPLQDTPAGERETAVSGPGEAALRLHFAREEDFRALTPDERKITDLNLFVFNGDLLESKVFLSGTSLTEALSKGKTLHLLHGVSYSVYCCANMGYALQVRSRQELLATRCYLAYADEFREGIPFAGWREGVRAGGDPIEIPLKRVTAKVSLQVDRSALHPDVSLEVRGVRVGGCPKEASLFIPSRVSDSTAFFIRPYQRDAAECAALNRSDTEGRSGHVSVYLLENRQGKFRKGLCSYIEVSLAYRSDSLRTFSEEDLVYRFYLDGQSGKYDVTRNTRYDITLRPEGTGLNGNSWRVDKRWLCPLSGGFFRIHPDVYNEAWIGDDLHIRCEWMPTAAPCLISTSDLDYDRERGIYDYTLDDDGGGVTLHMKKGGMGLFNIDFGPPINDGALIVVICEP